MQGSFTYGGTPSKLLSLVVNSNPEKLRHIFLVFANSAENLNEEFRKAGAIVEEVYRPWNWDVRFLWDILKISRRYRCAIINTHFARADIYGAIAGVLARIPVVKSVHGIAWNDSTWLQKLDGLLSPLRACTLCNSEATRRAVIRQTSAINTKVIYVGVPDHAVHLTAEQRITKRTELGLPSDGFVVLHVGGLIELREQSVILRAVKQCIETGINTYLIVVGDGPLRQRLETESRELGLSQRTHFLGYRNDVRELNSISDVYANMTREEGFGIAVIEAMQAGLPVVLANAGALPELIEDGVSGLLVPLGDHAALSRALVKLSQDRALSSQIGKAGQQRANQYFPIDKYGKAMGKLYEDVAKVY
jgi:glycosyltransferase involved in cell wall biosynthesis